MPDVMLPGQAGAAAAPGAGVAPVIPGALPDGPAVTTEAGHDFITAEDLQGGNAVAAGTPPGAAVPVAGASEAAASASAPGQQPGQQPATPPGTGASAEGTPTSTEPKPAPYDQDPKWLAARAAEKRMTGILQQHGFEDVEALEDALLDGTDLRELIGDRDINALLGNAGQQPVVAQQPTTATGQPTPNAAPDPLATPLDIDPDNDTPDEINSKLTGRIEALEGFIRNGRVAQQEETNTVQAITRYNNEVVRVLDDAGVADDSRDIYKLVLSVDNPMDNVEPMGPRSVIRKAAREGVTKMNEFVKVVQQQAVNDYASGKSAFIPATAGTGTGTPAPIVKPVVAPVTQPVAQPAVQAATTVEQLQNSNESTALVDAAFEDANAIMIEQLRKEEGL